MNRLSDSRIVKEAVKDDKSNHFNVALFSVLVTKVLAGRKHTDFCSERNISRATLSAIVNQKLDAPPSIGTIARISGRDEELQKQMIEACGYSLSDLQRIRANMEKWNISTKLEVPQPQDQFSFCMALLMKLSSFVKSITSIVHRTENREDFLIRTKDGTSVFGFGAFISDDADCDELHATILRRLLLRTLDNSDECTDANGVIMVFTNSRKMHEKLQISLSYIPEPLQRIAVVLSTDGRTVQTQEEVKFVPAKRLPGTADDFPIQLASPI